VTLNDCRSGSTILSRSWPSETQVLLQHRSTIRTPRSRLVNSSHQVLGNYLFHQILGQHDNDAPVERVSFNDWFDERTSYLICLALLDPSVRKMRYSSKNLRINVHLPEFPDETSNQFEEMVSLRTIEHMH
jgi:hypothetical protein